eukprot:gene3553-6288_t
MNEFLLSESILEKIEKEKYFSSIELSEEIPKEKYFEVELPIELKKNEKEMINKGLFIDIHLFLILENKKIKFQDADLLVNFLNEFYSKNKEESRIIFFIDEIEILKKFKLNSITNLMNGILHCLKKLNLNFPIYYHKNRESIICCLYLHSIHLIDSLWITKNEKFKKIGISTANELNFKKIQNNNTLIPSFYFKIKYLNEKKSKKFVLFEELLSTNEKSFYENNFLKNQEFGIVLHKSKIHQFKNYLNKEENDENFNFFETKLIFKGFLKKYPNLNISIYDLLKNLDEYFSSNLITISRIKLLNQEEQSFKIYSNFNKNQYLQEILVKNEKYEKSVCTCTNNELFDCEHIYLSLLMYKIQFEETNEWKIETMKIQTFNKEDFEEKLKKEIPEKTEIKLESPIKNDLEKDMPVTQDLVQLIELSKKEMNKKDTEELFFSTKKKTKIKKEETEDNDFPQNTKDLIKLLEEEKSKIVNNENFFFKKPIAKKTIKEEEFPTQDLMKIIEDKKNLNEENLEDVFFSRKKVTPTETLPLDEIPVTQDLIQLLEKSKRELESEEDIFFPKKKRKLE